MKRIVICGFIMIILIILGIVSYAYTDNAMDETEHAVENIANSFSDGDFERTKSLTRELSAMWRKKCKNYVFILTLYFLKLHQSCLFQAMFRRPPAKVRGDQM